jgi:hypothetical protein
MSSAKIERPDGVVFLVIVYCACLVIGLGITFLAVLTPGPTPELTSALLVAGLLMILRGIGIVRLFHLKKDAWIFFGVAAFVEFTATALDLVLGGSDYFRREHNLLELVVIWGLHIFVIVYAFRVARRGSMAANGPPPVDPAPGAGG